MQPAVAVGVDVGGTKLVAAAVSADGTVVERGRRTSPVGDPGALVDVVVELATQLGPGMPVGIGIAGIVDAEGTVRYAPNLRVADLPLVPRVRERLQVPVVAGNDANLALYAELVVGAARGATDVLMVTLGTGVGGGVVAGGRLVEGAHGFAGELGHVTIVEDGRPCPCGNRGCLEAYASGTAIGARAAERLAGEQPDSSLADLAALDGRAVSVAALEGDAFARDVLRETGHWLGVALAGLVNTLDPELVVLGGGASLQSAGFVVPEATGTMAARLIGAGHRPVPPIVLAQLGDEAGMVGAALRARDLVAGEVR